VASPRKRPQPRLGFSRQSTERLNREKSRVYKWKELGTITTFVVDYARSFATVRDMKEFPISTRYTADELKQLDQTARQCKMSRAELIHARSLGKIVTTHELADWAEAELAKNAARKDRRGSRAA
jgi:hypothetical protein